MRVPEAEMKSGTSGALRGRPQTSLHAHHLTIGAHAAAHGYCEKHNRRNEYLVELKVFTEFYMLCQFVPLQFSVEKILLNLQKLIDSTLLQ